MAYSNDLWEFNISTNEWTWVDGNDLAGGSGVYGTLGAPAGGSVPGSRSGSVGWSDDKGDLWLFGGYGVASNGGVGYLNDLWQFNTSTGDWTWMAGSSTVGGDGGQAGAYVTWMTPASSDVPGSRQYATGWTDGAGNLWLFGGYGYDSAASYGYMNDLWEFNPSTNEWAWMGGNKIIGLPGGDLPGVYGTKGTPAAGNIPSSRWGAASWTDSSGNFWLFGGLETGFEGNSGVSPLNDLWAFNPSANEWAWMGGSGASFPPYSGVYGTQGTPAPGNFPGSRSAASSWTDSQGNLWLYGGDGYDAGLYLNILNDVWKYVPSAPAPVPGFAVIDLNDQAYNNAESFVIATGTSGVTTINTVVADGFSGAISLSAANLPTGVTVSFSPASVTGFATTQATFTVGLNVTPGDYTITVAGTSGGVTETTTVSLTVGSAPPPTFTFGASPSSLTVNSASQGLVTLTLTPQYGFNSAVSFACSGLPTNATCIFSPTTVTPSGSAATTQLTISVGAQATAVRPDSHPFLPATGLAFVVSVFAWKRRRVLGGVLVALVLAGVGLISGCGGGGAGSGGSSGGGPSQNPVTYSVTVTATSATVMRTTTVTLTVN